MQINNKVVVVTGAGSGIGRASAIAFAKRGAAFVACADINTQQAQATADLIVADGGKAVAFTCDVGKEASIKSMVAAVEQQAGSIGVYFSNAGILGRIGGFDLEDELWDAMWRIHGMAHIWAARAVVPKMVSAGGGAFVTTASAAGLLSIVESAPYAVTKHATVAFSEWLQIAYANRAIQVSCLCPQSVATGMVTGDGGSAGLDGILSAQTVADHVVQAVEQGQFLILPHPQVHKYYVARATDTPRWLRGMQKLYAAHFEPGKTI
jgi:NAD(P)-dependent dehydrogenase (short-subunit alcohol dehydrogenase family)